MSEPTISDVSTAVEALHKIVETGHAQSAEYKSALEKINKTLDKQEEKNQELVTEAKRAEGLVEDLAEQKSSLLEQAEKNQISFDEMKSRTDELEALFARGNVPEATDWKQSDEYKALNTYSQNGRGGISIETKATLRTDIDTAGGFLVPDALDTELLKLITEIDPIRSVSRVRTNPVKTLEVPIRSTIPVATYEGEAETASESESAYTAETLTAFRQTFKTPITMDLLMNAAFDMESEMSQDAAEAFAFGEGQAFVTGTGFKVPEGFTVNQAVVDNTRDTAASGVTDATDVILLTGDLKVGYNPIYIMNRRTLAELRTLQSSAGGFLWAPGMNGPVQNTINGFPYILANSMGEHDTSSDVVMAFADMRRGYTIFDRKGTAVIRDEVTAATEAIINFTWHRWNTGKVVVSEAIKILTVQ